MTSKKDPRLKNFSLLNKRIDRFCDENWWDNLLKHYEKQNVIDCLFPSVKESLIEREKQLFEYFDVPYTEIKDNSLHYIIRELADRAGINGLKYKKFKKYAIGEWDSPCGEKFVLQVLYIHFSQDKSILNSIKQLIETDPDYGAYKRKLSSDQDAAIDGVSKRFYELLKEKSYIKEFYDECNATPKSELDNLLSQISTWLKQYPGKN